METKEISDKYYIKAVGNALKLLSLLASKGEAGITEIGSELGLSKAVVFRLLYTMKCEGFVYQNNITAKYLPSYRVFVLGTKVNGLELLGHQITTFLKELAEKTGETINIGVLNDGEVIHTNTVIGTQILKTEIKIGSSEPAYSTALGKILLSPLDWDDVKSRLGTTGLQKFTPNTITNWSDLKVELEKVRKQGYAIDDEESYIGIRCIAIPIRYTEDRIIAALSISAPASRFQFERVDDYQEILQETAIKINEFLIINVPKGYEQTVFQPITHMSSHS